MESVVSTVAGLYRTAHADLREAVRDLEPDALNWSPVSEAISVAALVVHTIGSEAEVLRAVRAVPGERDRDAEFRTHADTAADLVAHLDAADVYLDEMTGTITAADLDAMRPRGDRPPAKGLYWLVSNYGHAREHLAHVQLTLQLYREQKAR